MFRCTINPDSEIPVYRQLVDQINAQIRSGALKTGTQLPTVRELAEQMNLSCGTVKRVYDCLRDMGDIEMTRRRGSFVKYVHSDRDSRRLQAMTAIDRMIRQLTDLNFSPAEIQIFLSLKMREWGLKWSGLRIAMVTDCVEISLALERQLSRIGNVQIINCTLRQLREYPYSINEEADVILASQEDSQKLLPLLPDQTKLLKVALAPSLQCISRLAACAGRRIGVLCEGNEFAELVRRYMPEGFSGELYPIKTEELEKLSGLDVLIASEDAHIPQEIEIERIPFSYAIDEGTMIYLEERINRIREERQIQPGVLRF